MTCQSFTRRKSFGLAAALGAGLGLPARASAAARPPVYDVHAYGAVGDGVANDTAAIQRAIDAAGAVGGGAQVRLRKGKRYLVSAMELRGGIDFHIEKGAEILVSTNPADYANPRNGVLHAVAAHNLKISGGGVINGRSREFMTGFDAADEWWLPKSFRPRLLVLEGCNDLEIREVTFKQAPSWTVHLVGCQRVLVERVSIFNQMDVPNCDGIDPDHCQDVEIRNCHIVCGDDAIVIKTTAGFAKYGPSRNIRVRDCVLETQDSGLKIGTETMQDIHDVVFEDCRIVNSCRGLTIQLRDQGRVYNVTFRNITFVSRYFSRPWWGRGEAISFTALPRNPQTQLGTIHDIRVENVTGRAENSIRIRGHGASRVRNVTLQKVSVTFDRWTKYPGQVYDNRPTTVVEPEEKHDTVGVSIQTADNITLRDCRVRWGKDVPAYFTHALEARDVTGLVNEGFSGRGAHPSDQAIVVS
jgi:polygalacturonase